MLDACEIIKYVQVGFVLGNFFALISYLAVKTNRHERKRDILFARGKTIDFQYIFVRIPYIHIDALSYECERYTQTHRKVNLQTDRYQPIFICKHLVE